MIRWPNLLSKDLRSVRDSVSTLTNLNKNRQTACSMPGTELKLFLNSVMPGVSLARLT